MARQFKSESILGKVREHIGNRNGRTTDLDGDHADAETDQGTAQIDDPSFWSALDAINQAGAQAIADTTGGHVAMFGSGGGINAYPREADREAGA